MTRAQIIGTGSYAPEKVVTNDDLSELIDTTDKWIRVRTGISERRVAAADEQTSDMAVAAAKQALDAARCRPEDLDLIVVGTISGDMQMPACAAFVQHKLGASCPAFDVSAACAGSLFGMSVAEAYVRAGLAKRILVVGVELLSRLLNWNDRSTCVLFGDAAGAMVIGPSEDPERGIRSLKIHTDGATTDILTIPGGGSLNPTSAESLEKQLQFVHMNGREVYKFAVRALADVVKEALTADGLTVEDIDHVIPHQANIRIVHNVLDKLEIPREKAHLNIDRYGNTSSASVPVTLDETLRSGVIHEGQTLVMMAIGAGMSWGGAVVRW